MVFLSEMIRKFSTTSALMTRRLVRRSNPGLGHQINDIEDAAKVLQSDPEGFGDLESDLFNVHKSHKEHELDVKHQNEKIKMHIIKRKYFREVPLPNLLTYAEKEHIKFLHSKDEDEWTVEKLAESFPANAEIIRKILKARWSPLSPKRIQSHDTNVLQNWTQFKNGKYKAIISTELYEHLKKFAGRITNDNHISHNSPQTIKKQQWQKPISNEFSSIISSSQPKGLDSGDLKPLSHVNHEVINTNKEALNNETYLLGKIKHKSPITIHQLKSKYLNKIEDDSKNNSSNTLHHLGEENLEKVYEMCDNISNTTIVTTTDYTEKFKLNEVVISELDTKRYGMSEAKQRIYIPRKLRRKGATYSVKNCYYDDDGEFLYKVPGMIPQ